MKKIYLLTTAIIFCLITISANATPRGFTVKNLVGNVDCKATVDTWCYQYHNRAPGVPETTTGVYYSKGNNTTCYYICNY